MTEVRYELRWKCIWHKFDMFLWGSETKPDQRNPKPSSCHASHLKGTWWRKDTWWLNAFGSSTCVSGFGHVKTASVSRALDFKVDSDSSGFGHVKSAIPLVVSKPLGRHSNIIFSVLCTLDVEFEWTDSSGFSHVKSVKVAQPSNFIH